MQIVFDSMTGNVRRFAAGVQALVPGLSVLDLKELNLRGEVPTGEYLLLTYTFGQGAVPVTTAQFLNGHSQGLRGVVSSGSFHWGKSFGRAGDQIAADYRVPLIGRINKSGTAADRMLVAAWLTDHL